MRIPLGTTDLARTGSPSIPLTNRYFESDPTDQADQVSLRSRPCLKSYDQSGTGPIRAVYSQPGSFDDALFYVSGSDVRKYPKGGPSASIGTLTTTDESVSMAATDVYLFIADGAALYSYTENDYARGTLTLTGTISAAETVVIGTIHYKFATDLTPAADGSSGSPWLVALGLSAEEALQNLSDAISDLGVAGEQYSAAMVPNPDILPVSNDATTLVVRARDNGTGGNALATTETLTNGSWGAATLAGGGGTTFAQITTPDDVGIVSVGVIASFCICVVTQGQGKNGRFYWIEPGENVIDPLNFATAERSPDTVWEVKIVGDQFWLPGPDTNEVWVLTGDSLAPFQRQQGRLFDQGIWQGTIVKIKDDVMATGTDGVVYRIGDAPQVVSTPHITERIREAINTQRDG